MGDYTITAQKYKFQFLSFHLSVEKHDAQFFQNLSCRSFDGNFVLSIVFCDLVTDNVLVFMQVLDAIPYSQCLLCNMQESLLRGIWLLTENGEVRFGLDQWFPKWAVLPAWGQWENLGGRWSRHGRLGALGDPVNNYISVVLLTLSDQMS